MLFNNAIDPFLFKLHNSLRAKSAGIVRACADDIGITLSMLRHLRMIHPIFQECKTFAGLELGPVKCVIVPLCEWSEEVQKGILRWLHKNIPEWKSFKVAPYAKLLGFYLGPKAGSQNWEGPLKFMLADCNPLKMARRLLLLVLLFIILELCLLQATLLNEFLFQNRLLRGLIF